MAIEEKTIEQLKMQHGELASVTLPDGSEIVFRKPKRGEYDLFVDNRDKGQKAGTMLAMACEVHPGGAVMAALEKYPGALSCEGGFVATLTELAGVGSVSTKKL